MGSITFWRVADWPTTVRADDSCSRAEEFGGIAALAPSVARSEPTIAAAAIPMPSGRQRCCGGLRCRPRARGGIRWVPKLAPMKMVIWHLYSNTAAGPFPVTTRGRNCPSRREMVAAPRRTSSVRRPKWLSRNMITAGPGAAREGVR